jgi:hypothetical protein
MDSTAFGDMPEESEERETVVITHF